MPEQLGFDLPSITALDRADFLVAPSNAVAVAMIEGWKDWTSRKLLLIGPEGSGKSHLANVWANLSGAVILEATDLSPTEIPKLAAGHVVVEDIHAINNNPEAQTALFHLHNLVLAEGHSLLLTGIGSPGHWGIDLADLSSRLSGTQTAVLKAPDDALLSAVLAKLFSDRQLTPKADLIPYLIKRIDRSFAAARKIVVALDSASLAQKRPLTRNLAAPILDNHEPDAR